MNRYYSSAVNQVSTINSIEIPDNDIYHSENGFLFDKQKSKLLFVPRNDSIVCCIRM